MAERDRLQWTGNGVSETGYELEFEDTFEGDALDEGRWIAHYLPHWSTREGSAARYEVGGGRLRLRIDADQQPCLGVGVHPFGDPRIVDDFSTETVPIDAREFHVYQAEWTPEHVRFLVDGRLIKTVAQSPSYPMQLMLGIYEFAGDTAAEPDATAYPKQFVVDYVRGYRHSRPQSRPPRREGGPQQRPSDRAPS